MNIYNLTYIRHNQDQVKVGWLRFLQLFCPLVAETSRAISVLNSGFDFQGFVPFLPTNQTPLIQRPNAGAIGVAVVPLGRLSTVVGHPPLGSVNLSLDNVWALYFVADIYMLGTILGYIGFLLYIYIW